MQKFLYITDQEEYKDHSFIGPLFEKYLTKHFEIHIVYFSSFNSNFVKKDNQFIIPNKNKNQVLEVLKDNNIDLNAY